LTHLIECKASDDRLHSALARFAKQFPDATAVQAVGQLRQQQEKQGVLIVDAASWLAELAA
jgi:hypothetical protein